MVEGLRFFGMEDQALWVVIVEVRYEKQSLLDDEIIE